MRSFFIVVVPYFIFAVFMFVPSLLYFVKVFIVVSELFYFCGVFVELLIN